VPEDGFSSRAATGSISTLEGPGIWLRARAEVSFAEEEPRSELLDRWKAEKVHEEVKDVIEVMEVMEHEVPKGI
jgi:hypothetical protein